MTELQMAVLSTFLGFISSALIVGIGLIGTRLYQRRHVRRAVVRNLELHANPDRLINALQRTMELARIGSGYTVTIDLSQHLSDQLAELVRLDTKYATDYVDVLSKEDTVRAGIDKLSNLQFALITRRGNDRTNWSNECESIRAGIEAQSLALIKDVLTLYESELNLFRKLRSLDRNSAKLVGELARYLEETSRKYKGP